jgi:hypothetical protein
MSYMQLRQYFHVYTGDYIIRSNDTAKKKTRRQMNATINFYLAVFNLLLTLYTGE